MADFEHKENRGSLFPAKDKKTERSPDFSGDANIEGIKYWMSAWNNTPENGKFYLSVSLQKKDIQ
jgi:uncharacterized protein (DUF736 family)